MRTALLSWQLWAGLSAVFAALTAILTKLGAAGIDAGTATFLRTLVILASLAGFLLATGRPMWPADLPARGLLFLLLSGLATGASWLCYVRALQLGEAARVAPVDKLSVVLVAVLGTLLLGERLSGPAWLGVLLIAAGAILVARA